MESNLLIGSLAFSPCWRECSGCSVKNENPENPAKTRGKPGHPHIDTIHILAIIKNIQGTINSRIEHAKTQKSPRQS